MSNHYESNSNPTIWLTGLPCSGKTTLAKGLKSNLEEMGYMVAHLDGDDVRGKLSEDLGFSAKDRLENLRRVSHVANLFNENGYIVIASFVSPTNHIRDRIRGIVKNLRLVNVRCSLEECERRDVKGMYRKARVGEIKGFTGVSDPYEEPKSADVVVDTEKRGVESCVEHIIASLNWGQNKC